MEPVAPEVSTMIPTTWFSLLHRMKSLLQPQQQHPRLPPQQPQQLPLLLLGTPAAPATTTCVDPTTHAEMGCVARSGDIVVEVVLIAVTAARMDLASTKN